MHKHITLAFACLAVACGDGAAGTTGTTGTDTSSSTSATPTTGIAATSSGTGSSLTSSSSDTSSTDTSSTSGTSTTTGVDLGNASTSSSTSTGDTSTGELSTGDACAAPEVGMLWGPCTDEHTCSEGTCATGGIPANFGTVCIPACADCPLTTPCGGFTACGAPIEREGSDICALTCADGCPPGMACSALGGVSACVWENTNTFVCEMKPPVGEVYGPCNPDFSCQPGLQCNAVKEASMCVGNCDAWIPPKGKCSGAGCLGKDESLFAQCDNNAQCPVGMKCYGTCLWPF